MYVGEWRNDKRHGRGKYHAGGDNIREGIWEDDRRIKYLDQN